MHVLVRHFTIVHGVAIEVERRGESRAIVPESEWFMVQESELKQSFGTVPYTRVPKNLPSKNFFYMFQEVSPFKPDRKIISTYHNSGNRPPR